jgi:hypothetical protein
MECGIFGRNCCKKYVFSIEASHVLRNTMSFAFMNILCDISICFIALVYMDCLVFLRRLKHGGPWLNELVWLLRRRPRVLAAKKKR